jgi:hypothetical protein
MMRTVVVAVALVAAACRPDVTQQQCFASGTPRQRMTEAKVSPANLCVPDGTLVLIRGRGVLGALRFQDVRDIDPQSGTGCARFELHTRTDGAWRATDGAVASLGWFGAHPVVGEHGRTTIAGGGLKLQYDHPGCVELGRDLEYAPTGWTSLQDVDEREPRLQWFRRDDTYSRSVTIPLEELPGVGAAFDSRSKTDAGSR